MGRHTDSSGLVAMTDTIYRPLQLSPQHKPRLLPAETLQVIREEPASLGLSLVSLGMIYVVWFSLRNPQIVAFKNPACPEDRCGKSWPNL